MFDEGAALVCSGCWYVRRSKLKVPGPDPFGSVIPLEVRKDHGLKDAKADLTNETFLCGKCSGTSKPEDKRPPLPAPFPDPQLQAMEPTAEEQLRYLDTALTSAQGEGMIGGF